MELLLALTRSFRRAHSHTHAIAQADNHRTHTHTHTHACTHSLAPAVAVFDVSHSLSLSRGSCHQSSDGCTSSRHKSVETFFSAGTDIKRRRKWSGRSTSSTSTTTTSKLAFVHVDKFLKIEDSGSQTRKRERFWNVLSVSPHWQKLLNFLFKRTSFPYTKHDIVF